MIVNRFPIPAVKTDENCFSFDACFFRVGKHICDCFTIFTIVSWYSRLFCLIHNCFVILINFPASLLKQPIPKISEAWRLPFAHRRSEDSAVIPLNGNLTASIISLHPQIECCESSLALPSGDVPANYYEDCLNKTRNLVHEVGLLVDGLVRLGVDVRGDFLLYELFETSLCVLIFIFWNHCLAVAGLGGETLYWPSNFFNKIVFLIRLTTSLK